MMNLNWCNQLYYDIESTSETDIDSTSETNVDPTSEINVDTIYEYNVKQTLFQHWTCTLFQRCFNILCLLGCPLSVVLPAGELGFS